MNPNFKDNVTTVMLNPFIKLGGIEVFGTFEMAKGQNAVENGEVQYAASAADATVFTKLKDRKFKQIAIDVLYRFGTRDQYYAGAKYNIVKGNQVFGQSTTTTTFGGISQGTRADVSVERMAAGAGWFITRNILVKGEYVTQKYKDFPAANILEGGKFSGFVLQGSIAF